MAKAEEAYEERSETKNAKGLVVKVEVPYVVTEVNDEDAALDAARAKAMVRKFPGMVFDEVDVDERLTENAWKIKATYAVDPGLDTEEEEGENLSYTFDTSGGSMHMTQSLKTQSRVPATAPDFEGAIAVDNEGNIEGVDVTMPVFNFSETHTLAATKVTVDYRKTVMELTGTVNDAPFRGHAAGEVLFLGASGTRRVKEKDSPWEITFSFAVSPTKKNLKVGELTVGEKRGWDYLWVRYGDKVSKDGKAVVRRPSAAYVEKVYGDGSFPDLGIGS